MQPATTAIASREGARLFRDAHCPPGVITDHSTSRPHASRFLPRIECATRWHTRCFAPGLAVRFARLAERLRGHLLFVRRLIVRIGSPPAVFAVLAAAGVIAWTSHASAQNPNCADLGGNIIYGVGGSAQTPLIGQFASRLRDPANDADQLTIVYAEPGACYAPAAFDPDKTDAERYISATPSGTTARYWNQGNTTAQTCVLAADQVADFGSMQQYAEFCPGEELHAGLGDFTGPIGTVNVIVPVDSSQSSISSEALYFLFKFGDAGGLEPWKQDYLIRRNRTSAVQLQVLKAAGLLEETSGDINFGWDAGTNGASILAVGSNGVHGGDVPVTVPDAEATLGFVSGENAENNRATVRTLAYQHVGQECAYWPDSSSTALDKLNVRTGRYFLWGALHLFAPITGEDSVLEDIENEHVRRFVGYFTGEVEPPAGLPVLDIYIDNYNVPQCAMQVQRDEDLGPISSFQPEEPCGCYFDARATGRTSCEECETDDDCPSSDPVCRFGYCEVQ